VPILSRLDLVFTNRREASVLLGEPSGGARLVERLLDTGIGGVVVSAGRDGAAVGDRAGVVAVPALPAETVDVTGAGDALAAGTLAGIMSGLALADAVRIGIACAAATIECALPVSPALNYRLASERAAR